MKEQSPVVLAIFTLLIIGSVLLYARKQTNPVPQKTQTETVAEISPTVELSSLFLTISEPANNITVTNPIITVRGKTVAKAEVFVNDLDMKADSTGTFSTMVNLDEGENTIVIVVIDDQGNSAEKELVVTLEASK